ncbi:MAG: hypothetical protein HQL58_04805 [Magnetococcales bacterium]|nr:hypothetical protein [Magnetococcales bacterium]
MRSTPSQRLLATEQSLDDIADEIASLHYRAPRDEVMLQRYKQAAEAMLVRCPAKAHAVLAMIATLRRQEALMRQHFRTARMLAPLDAVTRVNHVAALQEFACLSEAVDVALRNCQELPHHGAISQQALEAAVFAGRLQLAANRLLADSSGYLRRVINGSQQILNCVKFLSDHDITDQHTESLQQQAMLPLRQAQMAVPEVSLRLVGHHPTQQVRIQFLLPASATDVAALNQQLQTDLSAVTAAVTAAVATRSLLSWVIVEYCVLEESPCPF